MIPISPSLPYTRLYFSPQRTHSVRVPAGMELSRLINGLPRGLRGFGFFSQPPSLQNPRFS